MILAQGYRQLALDLDGVVWTGREPIPGAAETIGALRDAGRSFAFLTNNSSRPAEEYAKRLARLGAGGDADEIVTSAHATARLLQTTLPDLRGRMAIVIGGPGLKAAVGDCGVHVIDGEGLLDVSMVVVGLDLDLTYDALRAATLAIRRGALFVASNDDPTMPAEDGQWPGAGAIVAALKASTGVEPLVAGKPRPTMLELARERLGPAGGTPLVVGDRISTDVAAARGLGWPSALVLTGATGVAELAAASIWPDAVIRGLPDLLEDLPHPQVRPATGPDLPHVAALLHAGGLQAGNVRERTGRTVVAEAGRGRIIGTAAWEPAGDVALLRSVAVAPEARGKGVAILVVAAALGNAHRAGIREAWLATTTAESFFARCGFTRVDRDDMPDAVADHPQVARECPSAAAVMRLTLPEIGS